MDSLVAYGSEDDKDNDKGPVVELLTSTKRKSTSCDDDRRDMELSHLGVHRDKRQRRKLPSLPLTLTSGSVLVPESDPSNHQGRIRTHPHVEGQFASYVYIPVSLERHGGGAAGTIGRLVRKAVKRARSMVPSIHPIVEKRGSKECNNDDDLADEEGELHISLSRPMYLRHHQREEFKKTIKNIASSHPPFSASFATFATFNNDEHTRAFLAFEVGAGHSQFHAIAEALTPALRALYQKEYYAQPRFHASIAWALLDLPPELRPSSCPDLLSDGDVTLSEESEQYPTTANGFATIPEFPPSLLDSLTNDLGEEVRHRGIFDVTEIKIRIGKAVSTYPLRGH